MEYTKGDTYYERYPGENLDFEEEDLDESSERFLESISLPVNEIKELKGLIVTCDKYDWTIGKHGVIIE